MDIGDANTPSRGAKINKQIAAWTHQLQFETRPEELTRLYIDRGHAFNMLDKPEESTKDYRQALEFATRPADLVHIKSMISLALLQADEREQSIWWAVSAVDSEPEIAEGNYVLGLTCKSCDLHKLAVRMFRRVLEIDPNDTKARMALGKCLRETGDLDAALREFDEYILAQPADPHGYFERGFTIQRHAALPSFISLTHRDYARVLELNPDERLRSRVTRQLEKLNRLDQAAKDLASGKISPKEFDRILTEVEGLTEAQREYWRRRYTEYCSDTQ